MFHDARIIVWLHRLPGYIGAGLLFFGLSFGVGYLIGGYVECQKVACHEPWSTAPRAYCSIPGTPVLAGCEGVRGDLFRMKR